MLRVVRGSRDRSDRAPAPSGSGAWRCCLRRKTAWGRKARGANCARAVEGDAGNHCRGLRLHDRPNPL
ncbi:hypothetical protein G6F22_021535 [Rhizopus arrhizus]|nr:hypothetical protein G6F22_021535 [Rhizopus arrhizus]KAG0907217.1 hypothetical protein G6F31_021688 [Rhizopus arrhizus]KAG1368904.1 hypothetical protein G6F59_018765 [Rhizopus arrhizus]